MRRLFPGALRPKPKLKSYAPLLNEKYKKEIADEPHAWQPKYAAQERYYKKNSTWARSFRRQLRKEMIQAYGSSCACCGESHWQFLTLDHPSGNGQEDRLKYRKRTGQIYRHLKKCGWPKKGYRLLCMNCNWSQRFTKKCPHKFTDPSDEVIYDKP